MKSALALKEFCDKARSKGLSISATSGVFDVLHDGHVKYLIRSSELADILIVGIDCDLLVKRFKGKSRPYWGEDVRALNIAAHEHVDIVHVIEARQQLVRIVRPDFFVMSETTGNIEERHEEMELIKKLGGETVVFGSMSQNSTTAVLKKMRNRR